VGAAEDVLLRTVPVGRNRDSAAGRRRVARTWVWATLALSTGALVLAALLAPPPSSTPDRALAWLLFVGSSVHVASTGWLFGLPEVRAHAMSRRARFVVLPGLLVAGCAVLAVVLPPRGISWLLLPFFAWQFFHFQKQNLGMVALVASSQRLAPLARTERRAITVAGCAGICGLVARPGLLQLQLGFDAGLVFELATVAFSLCCLVGAAVLKAREPAARPASFCVAFVMALVFFAPVFLFSSPYAAIGGATIAHGLQYVLLVGLVASGSRSGRTRTMRIALFCNVALIGGLALNVASHLHGAATWGRLLFGVYLGVSMAHFVVDGGFWRLREPFPRAFMASNVPYLLGHDQTTPPTDRSAGDIR